MVRISDYKLRESLEGKSFFALILQGGLEIVKSAAGSSYATIKTASMPSTFDESTCKAMVGLELAGTIQKVECEPYAYTIEATGEMITLHHRYEYVEDEKEFNQDFMKVYKPSENGVKQLV